MKASTKFSSLLLAVLPALLLHAESVSTPKAVLEWKNNVMEYRGTGDNPGRIIFRPYFTNGTKLENVTATEITIGRKAILLHGKDCSLTFAFLSQGAAVRVSAPKNAGFTVETATAVMVVPDGLSDDLVLEPGKQARNLPGWVPFFMGLQGKENWTLSCIPYLGRSDISISADLKKWEFKPQPLEEYTFVVQSGAGIWKKVGEKLDLKERKTVDWNPPFPAQYRAAFPMAQDYFDIGEPKYMTWDVMEEVENGKRPVHCSTRVYIIDRKAQTGWSSGVFGTAPYPAFRPLAGQLQMIYPRMRIKRCKFDLNLPVYIYTYDFGSRKRRIDSPISFLEEYTRPVMTSYPSSSIGLGPATCTRTVEMEKIFSRDEARAKRSELRDGIARMQIFVESIRARAELFLSWADEMKKECLAAAEKGGGEELRKFAAYFDSMEKCHQPKRAKMKVPEYVWGLGEQLMKDLDNKELDDEALEKRSKDYGRAVREIGGNQDNCVAECHYTTGLIRREALAAYMQSTNAVAKEFYRRIYQETSRMLQNSFNHEGK